MTTELTRRRHVLPLLGVFVLALITCLAPASRAADASLVLNTADREPYVNGDGTGFYEKIISIAADRAGIDVVINRLPSERSLVNAVNGFDDGEFGRIAGIAEKYPSLVMVDEPLVSWQFMAIPASPEISVTSWDDMAGLSVVCVNGWVICEQNVPSSAASFTTVSDDNAFAAFLALDRADVGVLEPLRFARAVRMQGIDHEFGTPAVLASRPMYLFLHKHHADIAPRLAEAIASMKKDGTYDAILAEFTGVRQ